MQGAGGAPAPPDVDAYVGRALVLLTGLCLWPRAAARAIEAPQQFADQVTPLADLSRRLHLQDKAFFYSRFIVEDVR